jgi:hypothetical protein
VPIYRHKHCARYLTSFLRLTMTLSALRLAFFEIVADGIAAEVAAAQSTATVRKRKRSASL